MKTLRMSDVIHFESKGDEGFDTDFKSVEAYRSYLERISFYCGCDLTKAFENVGESFTSFGLDKISESIPIKHCSETKNVPEMLIGCGVILDNTKRIRKSFILKKLFRFTPSNHSSLYVRHVWAAIHFHESDGNFKWLLSIPSIQKFFFKWAIK